METKAHYGNPLVEQRELQAGRAKVLLASSVIEVTGEDRLDWLHSMLTSDFKNLHPGDSREALLLDVNGHVLNDFHAIATNDSILLIVESSATEVLLEHFDRMIFRSRVDVSLRDDLVVFGAHTADLSGALAVWHDPWPNVVAGGVRYAHQSPLNWTYFEYVVLAAAAENFAEELSMAGTDAQASLRVAAHRPALSDVDDRTLPHELDWLATAVHLTKGCYRGQEAVAKTHNLGHPPRRIAFLHLDGSSHTLPSVGSDVLVEGSVVGRLTSVAQHFEAGPIALAMLKRNTPVDAQVEVVDGESGSWAATQEVIVPPTAGKANDASRRNLLMGKGH